MHLLQRPTAVGGLYSIYRKQGTEIDYMLYHVLCCNPDVTRFLHSFRHQGYFRTAQWPDKSFRESCQGMKSHSHKHHGNTPQPKPVPNKHISSRSMSGNAHNEAVLSLGHEIFKHIPSCSHPHSVCFYSPVPYFQTLTATDKKMRNAILELSQR